MDLSTEMAVELLHRWQSNSSKLRCVFGGNFALVSCHCSVHRVDDSSWIWCISDHLGDEVRFDLSNAISVALSCKESAVGAYLVDMADQTLSISWPDGTRLIVVSEDSSRARQLVS